MPLSVGKERQKSMGPAHFFVASQHLKTGTISINKTIKPTACVIYKNAVGINICVVRCIMPRRPFKQFRTHDMRQSDQDAWEEGDSKLEKA